MPNGKTPCDAAPRTGEIRLLREIAAGLREIARNHPTAMSEKLREVAKEFDDHAAEIERRPPRN